MAVEGNRRLVLRYGVAVLAAGVALGLMAVLDPVVGFVPLPLLGAVAFITYFAGARPAVVGIVICTLASLAFVDRPDPSERLNNIAHISMFPPIAGAIVYLMELHRRQKRVYHEQSLELSTLLESMTDAVFVCDPQGYMSEVNRATERLCALPREGIIGRHYEEIAAVLQVRHGEVLLPTTETGLARALRGETIGQESRTYVNPIDGSPIHALISASPLRVGGGRLIGALLVIRDVTELTSLQQRVADTERHLAIGQMASGLAHDFNNVLNTITQASALLQIEPEQSNMQKQRYLMMIDRAARTGAEIIKRVRDYVRGGSGEPSVIELSEIIREAVELAEPLWRPKKSINLQTRLGVSSRVFANPADLRRVFANLIINAIQAMPDGGLLMVSCHERNGKVVAEVTDTGEGISQDAQKKIFLPYYTTKATGTGLGLSTAQKILLAHGGTISFTSSPGKGTTFRIELPVVRADEEPRRQTVTVALL